jgi:hypothetical protein
MRTFEELSGAVITEGYGMSETSNIVTANPLKTVRKPGGVGLPFPDNDVRIVDLETGTIDMPLGEPGELLCKAKEPAPLVGTSFRANLFWMGRNAMIADKPYNVHFFGIMGNDSDGEGGFFGHPVQNLTFEKINSAILPLMC